MAGSIALRLTCLRSQVAAGHKVTVYSFDPLPGLPDGVGNAEAEAILPHSFSERLRPPQPDGSWRDWTILQFSDFFRMRLMAEKAGLWLDADVLLLKPVEIDPAKPYFAWERRRQLGNSVLYLPANDPIVRAFEELMEQEDLTPDWLALRHRITFMLRQLRHRSSRLSDIRVAIYGPAAITALARRAGRTAARAAEAILLRGACRAEACSSSRRISPRCSPIPGSSGCISRPRAAAARSRFRAASMRGPRRSSANSRAALSLLPLREKEESPLPKFDLAQRPPPHLCAPWRITAKIAVKGAVP